LALFYIGPSTLYRRPAESNLFRQQEGREDAARRAVEPDLEKFSRGAWRTRAVSLETDKTCLSEA
ncbi:MAG: hypothetical protein NTX99_07875, partial [Candidatus Aminicenantes bacterium]|nr:hypothetical protein [Candidatus Aminicenantes bacterium]